MSRKKKPGLTRRVDVLYHKILADDRSADSWYWPHPYAYTWGSSQNLRASMGWMALLFAQKWIGRNIDLKRLGGIVARSGDPECAYQFARDIPGISSTLFKRLQQVVIYGNNPKAICAFMTLPGADVKWLSDTLLISQIMDGTQ